MAHAATETGKAVLHEKRQMLRDHLVPAFGDLRLDQISARLIDHRRRRADRSARAPAHAAPHVRIAPRDARHAAPRHPGLDGARVHHDHHAIRPPLPEHHRELRRQRGAVARASGDRRQRLASSPRCDHRCDHEGPSLRNGLVGCRGADLNRRPRGYESFVTFSHVSCSWLRFGGLLSRNLQDSRCEKYDHDRSCPIRLDHVRITRQPPSGDPSGDLL